MSSIAIIGGGASGLVAAIEAKRHDRKANVTVYEQNKTVGKKILVTGNGRCNILNSHIDEDKFSSVSPVVRDILNYYDFDSNSEFLRSIGLKLTEDDAGRVYPASNSASSVVQVLLAELEHLGVRLVTETKIEKIEIQNNSFILNEKFVHDAVIISVGGISGTVYKTDGAMYSELEKMGILLEPSVPVLVPLKTRQNTNSLKGVRCRSRACVHVLSADKRAKQEFWAEGEIQYTDYGLSGIMIMDLSTHCAKAIQTGMTVYVTVDSYPKEAVDETESFILDRRQKNGNASILNCLAGFLPDKLSSFLTKEVGIGKDEKLKDIDRERIHSLCEVIHSMRYDITDTMGFGASQVTGGGVKQKELNRDLMLKKTEGLFVCGEIVDIHGICGGYNLSWAISSGRCAGRYAAEYLRSKNA